jgi:hypothetical protein
MMMQVVPYSYHYPTSFLLKTKTSFFSKEVFSYSVVFPSKWSSISESAFAFVMWMVPSLCSAGKGKAILDEVEHMLEDGSAIVIPAGMKHNVINTSTEDKLKLYTIYSPAEHKDGTIHMTKANALSDIDDHFDGKTTE